MQTPSADNENVDYGAVNKQLDKMTAELNSGKIGPGATGDMLDKINDLQDKLNQNLPLLNNDLGSVQKKIAALGEVPDDGNEPAEIAKQRKELNKQADAYKTSIAQAKLDKNQNRRFKRADIESPQPRFVHAHFCQAKLHFPSTGVLDLTGQLCQIYLRTDKIAARLVPPAACRRHGNR